MSDLDLGSQFGMGRGKEGLVRALFILIGASIFDGNQNRVHQCSIISYIGYCKQFL